MYPITSLSLKRSVFKINMAHFEKGIFRLTINYVEDIVAIYSVAENLPCA